MKIFITGISSGIGESLATKLSWKHEVWGITRDATIEYGTHYRVSLCDLQNFEDIKKVILQLREKQFIPDVFILNAGVYYQDFNFKNYTESFLVNVNGALAWIAEFLPDCLNRGWGRFILVSSTAAYQPNESIPYSVSKAAISSAFQQFQQYPLVFQTVYLGPVDTKLFQGKRTSLVITPDQAEKYIESLLTQKSGSYYFPWWTRCLRFIPKGLYQYVSQFLR